MNNQGTGLPNDLMALIVKMKTECEDTAKQALFDLHKLNPEKAMELLNGWMETKLCSQYTNKILETLQNEKAKQYQQKEREGYHG